MISRKDFLALVLPPLEADEYYCTVGIKENGENKDINQRFVTSIDEICQHADEFVAGTYNAFFAMAKYGTEKRRTTKNALALKSFYIDLDCGPGKPFADITHGMLALKDFCRTTGLPRPTVVKSGMGAHLYWVCDEPIPREKWALHAERLKALCVQHKFDVDPVVTGEAARVLRIPETMHVKDPTNPIPVEVLSVAPTLPFTEIHRLLEPTQDILEASKAPVKRQLDPLTLMLMGNSQSRFKTILTKSLQGTGCAQIANAFNNQDTLEEPLWRAALSIAQQCVDRDKAIHILSRKHPGYSAEATEQKANDTKGPYTCETFRKTKGSLCEGCPHKFSSPIQLGKEIAEAKEGDNVIIDVQEIGDGQVKVKEAKEYIIPKYPYPFFRGKNGGVYRHTKTKDDEDIDELLFPFDFYVVKRMIDPDLGDTIFLRFHSPNDGVRERMIPAGYVVAKEKLMAVIAEMGITVLGKQQEAVQAYINAWAHHLMTIERAEKAHRQFGWTEDESGIIIGDREIRATEVVYSPPSAPTLPLVPFFQPKGDFHVWKDIINYYANPGMEARAFAFFLGFGAPLMRLTGLDGFLLNLVSRDAGTGKTTTLYAINSIYGRPRELALAPKDTYNVRMNRLGTMQNLAVTMDEITNMEGEQMSQQVYDVTMGRGKHRLKQHDNVERNNNTKFQTGMITSSNRSITDVLLSAKAFPDGELKRILEIQFRPDGADATWSRNHFERLMHNYGHAITPYAQALVGQLPYVKDIVNDIRTRVDTAADIHKSERYWGLMVSLSIAGGRIAKKLGLHDIPIQPVFDFAINLIKETRDRNRTYTFDGKEFLSVFLGDHFHEILVINGSKDKRTGLEQGAIKEPRGQLIARYEPDSKTLFVSMNSYRKACNKAATNFEESLESYVKSGALILHGSKKDKVWPKRLFAGTLASNNAATRCLWFDTTKLDFFDEKALLRDDKDIQPADPDPVG